MIKKRKWFEVYGTKNIEGSKTSKNLISFKNKINAKIEPSFLAIITAYPYCYKRDDGVYIIPIQVLKD